MIMMVSLVCVANGVTEGYVGVGGIYNGRNKGVVLGREHLKKPRS